MNINALDPAALAFLRRFTMPRQRSMVALACAIVTRGEASDVDALTARMKAKAKAEVETADDPNRADRFRELADLLIQYREEGRAFAQAVLVHRTRLQSVIASRRYS